jgi:hypothetical protein
MVHPKLCFSFGCCVFFGHFKYISLYSLQDLNGGQYIWDKSSSYKLVAYLSLILNYITRCASKKFNPKLK